MSVRSPNAASLISRRAFLASGSLVALGVIGCRKRASVCTASAGDAKLRAAAGYLEPSPDPQRACSACQQWLEMGSDRCGGCKLISGPIHPRATCRLFAVKS
jgi:hypothetical protein